MWRAILETIRNVTAIVFKLQTDKNAGDMKTAAKQQDEANARAKEIKTVQAEDTEQIRKDVAE